MEIREILKYGQKELSEISDVPDIESIVLLEYVTKLKREYFFTNPEEKISETDKNKYFKLIEQRVIKRVPLSYIIQEKEFYSLKLYVNKNVLIPRPETEKIVEIGLDFLKKRKNPNVLDIGTGSGNIIIALSYYGVQGNYFASDISFETIKVAKFNAMKYKRKIKFLVSDIFSGIKKGKRFDLIVSNPPYVSNKEYKKLQEEILKEPIKALLSSENGIKTIKEIFKRKDDYLKADGMMIIEIGEKQDLLLTDIIENNKFKIIKDVFGKKRFLLYENGL